MSSRLRRHFQTIGSYCRADSKEATVALLMLRRPRSRASIVEFVVPNKRLINQWKREKAKWKILKVYRDGRVCR